MCDMLKTANQYRHAIDNLTADKSSKLRQYELDDDDWIVLEDLLRVLRYPFVFSNESSL